MKVIAIIVLGILIIGMFCSAIYFDKQDKEDKMEEPKYQGPVRLTDDEEHFRKTGETIPLEVKE